MVSGAGNATPTTSSTPRDVRPKPKQGLADQFQLLEAGEGKKDILIAVHVTGEKRGVWILEGSRWVKQCDVPKNLPERGVCFCAVADGLLAMGGVINDHNSPVCYHYSLSERRWRKLPDMIKPKKFAEAVEISPMLAMVVAGLDETNDYSSNCEILDMKQGKWSSVKPLPGDVEQVLVAATDGRVFIMKQRDDYSAPIYQLHEYHPSSHTYTSAQIVIPGSDADQFYSSNMAGVAGKLYLVGHINIEYDITTQCITQLPKPKASYVACCATVRGKNILLCGGYDNEHSLNAMEEYNTTTKQWKMMDVSLPSFFDRGKSFVANISI